jgi:hypothetical protein
MGFFDQRRHPVEHQPLHIEVGEIDDHDRWVGGEARDLDRARLRRIDLRLGFGVDWDRNRRRAAQQGPAGPGEDDNQGGGETRQKRPFTAPPPGR